METKNIYQKLLEAQKEIGAIKKDSDNPFFHSKYVDINGILREVKPVLNKHGLVLTQALHTTEGRIGLLTAITDSESKEKIDSFCFLPETVKAQETGSAITYFRRYALQSLLALEAEDDDGNGAIQVAKKKESKNEEKFMADLKPTEKEIMVWEDKIQATKDLKELKAVWEMTPPMIKVELERLKNEHKFKLS